MDWAVSIGFGAAIVAAAGYAGVRVFAGYPKKDEGFQVLTSRELGFLEAAALTMFPPGGALSPSGLDAGIPRYMDLYLGRVTPRLRRLMRLLFFLFEHATIVFGAPGRGGRRRFSSLAPEQRVAVLEAWEESRIFAST